VQPRQPLPRPFDTHPFSTREALAAGLGRGRLAGNDLVQPFRGVNLPSSVAPTLEARCAALQERLPAHAFFSGITAARLIGVPLPTQHELSQAVHVAVPPPHTAPTGKGVIGHQLGTSSWQYWHGIRVSTPGRAWCELASALTIDELVAAGDYLISWELTLISQRELCELVGRMPARRGIRKLRVAVELLHDRSGSVKETQLRLLILRAGFIGLSMNLPIITSGGFRYRGDFAFEAERVIIEYQSAYHASLEQFRADMTRRSRLEADGWFVMEVNSDDLANPAELMARLRRVLDARAR